MLYIIVDGGWGQWAIEPCSKTCGGGIRKLTRECNNPTPSCGGQQCEGDSQFIYPGKCHDFCCPGKDNMTFVANYIIWLCKSKQIAIA